MNYPEVPEVTAEDDQQTNRMIVMDVLEWAGELPRYLLPYYLAIQTNQRLPEMEIALALDQLVQERNVLWRYPDPSETQGIDTRKMGISRHRFRLFKLSDTAPRYETIKQQIADIPGRDRFISVALDSIHAAVTLTDELEEAGEADSAYEAGVERWLAQFQAQALWMGKPT